MDNKRCNIYETIKDIYENVIKKGEIFSINIGKEIKKELEKMKKQRDEWLKSNNNEETNITDNSNS